MNLGWYHYYLWHNRNEADAYKMGTSLNSHAIRIIFRKILRLAHMVIHRRCGVRILLVASRPRGFPLPRWDGIGLGPQACPCGSGQFFHVFEGLIASPSRLHPSQSLFDQLLGNLSPVRQQNIGGNPTLSIPLHIPYDNLAIGDISSCGMFRLLSIGLFQLRTIHPAKIHHVLSALMVDSEAISFVDNEDPRDELAQSKRRRDENQRQHQDCCNTTAHHDVVCYRQ
jgi:hypothetical protein